jgi:hypothetical protein
MTMLRRKRIQLAVAVTSFNSPRPEIHRERLKAYKRTGLRKLIARIACLLGGHQLVLVGEDCYECGCAQYAAIAKIRHGRHIAANIVGSAKGYNRS